MDLIIEMHNEHSKKSIGEEMSLNPNYLHDLHMTKRGHKGVPEVVMVTETGDSKPKDPGHSYANTQHIAFQYFDQRKSNAPFGYEHFVSLPPNYEIEAGKYWPLILYLHGSGESQQKKNESFLSVRHGIPKIILCYDELKAHPENPNPSISIPRTEQLDKSKRVKEDDNSDMPVPEEVCCLLAENFITVTPSLNKQHGYGWNASILSVLLDEIVDRYRVDINRIHVTGFSMGGFGTWDLGLHTPNRFASLMPICGGGDTLRVNRVKNVSVWAHHGDLDNAISVEASTQMVNALIEAGATDVKYTRYPNLMHDSWTEAYNNPEVYKWILAKKRTSKGDEKAIL